MLWTLLASAVLLARRTSAQISCVTDGSTAKVQDGDNNYVIDSFSSSLYFSYAIGQCTGADIAATEYYKYTCTKDDDDVWWVTKTSYSNNACTEGATIVDTWSSEDITAGDVGYFKCDGKNNYAKIEIGVDSECTSTTTLIGGLNGCASNPDVLDTNFYCDSSMALVQLFVNPAVTGFSESCTADAYCNKWEFTSTCNKVTNLFGTDVYGTFSKCATSESSNDGDDNGDDDESSASSPMTVLAIVVSLVVGLFH